MTAKLVDDITDTHSNKTRESIGQGIANVVTGFFGGMGGCAMIGQTMINVKTAGARTRLSTFLAGVFLMILCIVFGPLVSKIPMAALVAVMVLVAFGTFDWHSIAPATLKRMPAGEIIGHGRHRRRRGGAPTTSPSASSSARITAMVIFARRVAHLVEVTAVTDPDGGQVVYAVTGRAVLRLQQRPGLRSSTTPATRTRCVIDLTAAHIWDASTVAALDAITTKYAARGKTVEIVGLNEPSATMHGGSPANSPAATDRADPARPARHHPDRLRLGIAYSSTGRWRRGGRRRHRGGHGLRQVVYSAPPATAA